MSLSDMFDMFDDDDRVKPGKRLLFLLVAVPVCALLSPFIIFWDEIRSLDDR